jgi:hypothetical protein
MKCPKCNKEIGFIEWFIYNYQCKDCLNKNKSETKKKKHKEKINSLKKQYPPEKIWKSLLKSFLYSLLIVSVTQGPLYILVDPLSLIFFIIVIFGIKRLYLWFKFKPLRDMEK